MKTIDVSCFLLAVNDRRRMIVLDNLTKFNAKVRLEAASNFMVQSRSETIREQQYREFQCLANQKRSHTGIYGLTWWG